MKQSIDSRRMTLWAGKFWFENRKAYFLFLLVLAGLLFVWQGMFLAFRNPNLFSERVQFSQYAVLLFFSGCLTANFLFGDLREKSKSITYLLNPASSLEKILVVIFFGVPVFFLGFNLAFYAVDSAMVSMANKQNVTNYKLFNVLHIKEYENPFMDNANSAHLLYLYFAVQSFFIFGAIYFKKFSLLKTSISLFAVWVLFIVVQTLLSSVLPVGDFFAATATYRVTDMEGYKIIYLPDWLRISGALFFKFLIVPLFWLATYFRLREKQVI